jgi:hypothetical protein
MDHIVKGKHDQSFTSMARHTSSATNLDLGCEGMKHAQQLISEIWALYKVDFPNTSDSNSAALPSTELQVPLLIAGEYTPAHVKASNSIESEEEYHATLSAYQEQCRKLLEDSTMEYIELRIAFVTESDPQTMNRKLDRVSFMREPGRKLFIYDSMVQDPSHWSKLRRHKRSFLTGAKVTMICQSAGQAGQDTLNTLKDIYLTYRTERQPDQLSEDIVAAIVPGVAGDSPDNDFLAAAWRSLKGIGEEARRSQDRPSADEQVRALAAGLHTWDME